MKNIHIGIGLIAKYRTGATHDHIADLRILAFAEVCIRRHQTLRADHAAFNHVVARNTQMVF